MKTIYLTIKGSNAKVLINIEHIVAVIAEQHQTLICCVGMEQDFGVNETYEAVLSLIPSE